MRGGRRQHRWRAAAIAVAGTVGVLAAGSVALASAYAGAPASGSPTADNRAGTCHLAEEPLELVATLSDTTPPVPCTVPHQTETAWQLQLTGPLTAQRVRPNPELLLARFARLCDDYPRIRDYLGARPQDAYWGISAWAKFPSRSEWARGVRLMVCELSTDPNSPSGPTVSYPIARFLRRADSSALRLCRAGTALVTCDQPHDAEATSPTVDLPVIPWPGPATEQAMGRTACVPVVDSYLNADIASRPDLVIDPEGPTEMQWAKGVRTVTCWIAQGSGRQVTGTVRGGFA